MKRSLALLALGTALVGSLTGALAAPLSPRLTLTADASPYVLIDSDDNTGGWLSGLWGSDDDEEGDDDDAEDDDCGDDDEDGEGGEDDDCATTGNAAPAGTVTPPKNGLFGSGAAPKATMN